jgi:cobalt-zinc-cadmium efflux system protein
MSNDHIHKDLKGKRLGVSILLNILITIAQVIGGLISGSLSLLSDALHNFSDVISLFVSYIANLLSRRKHTVEKTFGYKRAEIVAAFINAATLIIIAILIGKEAIVRLSEPAEVKSGWVIILALASIAVNGLSVLLLQKDAKGNMNIKSAYLHLFSDMVTSVAVLIGGFAMFYFKIYWVDSVLSIIIAIYLIYISGKLLIKSLKVLMLFTPSNILISDINSKICRLAEIKNIHHVHLWQLNDKSIHFEAHVDFNENISILKFESILAKIEKILFKNFNIQHCLLQPEFKRKDKKDIIVQE